MTQDADEFQPDDWLVEEGVRCVVAPCCAFTFDAHHTDLDGDSYSCPLCAEIALTRENMLLRKALSRWQDFAIEASTMHESTLRYRIAGLRRLDREMDVSGSSKADP